MTGQHPRDLPGFLRAPRAAGLWLAGVLIGAASVVAFGLSYHGNFEWALHHQWSWYVAVWFPFLLDVLIVVCEVILFVAAIDGGTPWRVRAVAWLVLAVFTGLSAVGNADHAAAASALTRGGFALPPLVLAIALGLGLGELKRQAAKYRGASPGASAGASVRRKLPSLREIQARQGCGQETAKKIKAELAAFERGREALSPMVTGVLPAAPGCPVPPVSDAELPPGSRVRRQSPAMRAARAAPVAEEPPAGAASPANPDAPAGARLNGSGHG